MSGPKALTCREFNKALNTIFRMQHRISVLIEKLKNYRYSDQRSGLSLDAGDFYSDNRRKGEKLCATFHPDYMGTAREHRQLLAKQEQLQRFLDRYENKDRGIRNQEREMERYSSCLHHLDRCRAGFIEYRKTAADSIKKVLRGDEAEKAAQAILAIDIHLDEEKFSPGFSEKRAEVLKQKYDRENSKKLEEIDRIRMHYLDSGLAAPLQKEERTGQAADNPLADMEKYSRRQDLLAELHQLIGSVGDKAVQEAYTNSLQKLIADSTFTDPWFYSELLEEIRLEEENRRYRLRAGEILHRLDETAIPDALLDHAAKTRSSATAVLNSRKITEADMEALEEETAALEKELQVMEEEAAVRERQNRFLKENLISGLRSLGYKMADDTRVIDFTQTDDFLLDIPDQDNFLNIRFAGDSGDFLYNFLIPEEKNALDSGQTKTKLAEMQSACNDFKKTLEELGDLGVSCDITRDIPVSEAAILQLPERLRSRLGKKRSAAAIQEKKKYLDQP